jgi:hypothetical protein
MPRFGAVCETPPFARPFETLAYPSSKLETTTTIFLWRRWCRAEYVEVRIDNCSTAHFPTYAIGVKSNGMRSRRARSPSLCHGYSLPGNRLSLALSVLDFGATFLTDDFGSSSIVPRRGPALCVDWVFFCSDWRKHSGSVIGDGRKALPPIRGLAHKRKTPFDMPIAIMLQTHVETLQESTEGHDSVVPGMWGNGA